MKGLILLLALSLCGCGVSDFRALVGIRKFKVGDCLIMSLNPPEKWEKAKYVVTEVGKHSYQIRNIEATWTQEVSYGHFWEDFYQKAPCYGEKP